MSDFPMDALQSDYFRPHPRELSTRELEDLIRNHSLSESRCSPSLKSANPPSPQSKRTSDSSRAFASAMKALQDKVKTLESENFQLSQQLSFIEHRTAEDRDKVQAKLQAEARAFSDKERGLAHKLALAEDEVRRLTQELAKLKDQVKIKDTQIHYAEAELTRNAEQHSVDRQNLVLQVEYLQKSLNSKQSDDRVMKESREKLSREKSLVDEELAQNKRLIQSLEAETKFLRDNSDAQRQKLVKEYESLEAKFTKQNTEFNQKIKQLQVKNKTLNELNQSLQQQVEHLKKEITENVQPIRTRNKSEGQFKRLQKQASDRQLRSPRVLKQTLKNTAPRPQKPAPSKSIDASEDTLRETIGELEKEIQGLNLKYRGLLTKSNEETSDLGLLRKEICGVTSEIEKKSQRLVNLKKKQQDILKSKLK